MVNEQKFMARIRDTPQGAASRRSKHYRIVVERRRNRGREGGPGPCGEAVDCGMAGSQGRHDGTGAHQGGADGTGAHQGGADDPQTQAEDHQI